MSIFAQGEGAAIASAYFRRFFIVLGILAALGLLGIVASYYGCQMHNNSKEADVIVITLTEQNLGTASRYEQQILDTGLNARTNYTHLSEQHRYLVGYLGEFAFVKLLAWRGKRYEYKPQPDGDGHPGGDVTVWMKGVPTKIDVKTASQPGHRCMLSPEHQFQSRPCPYYVGVRLDLDAMCCEIHGWLRRSEYEECPALAVGEEGMKVATRRAYLKDLRPTVELLNDIDKARNILRESA